MRIFKISIMSLIVLLIGVSCVVNTGSATSTSTTPTCSSSSGSDGCKAVPVTLSTNTTYYGKTDGINSSYYIKQATGNNPYLIDVTSLTTDVDVYVYDDSNFSVLNTGDGVFSSTGNPATTIGLASEYLTIYHTSTLYIEVRPMGSISGGTYNIYVH